MQLFKNLFGSQTKQKPVKTPTQRFSISHSFFGSNKQDYALYGYINNVIANRCIKLIATSASSTRLKLVSKSDDGEYVDIPQHEILDLLHRPNITMDYSDFIENMVSEYQIYGESYVSRSPLTEDREKPLELWNMSAKDMSIIKGDRGIPAAYVYMHKTPSEHIFPVDPISGRADIMLFKSYNPLDEQAGLSSMESAKFSVDIHNAGMKHNYSSLKNGGTPSLGFKPINSEGKPKQLSDEEFEEFTAWIKDVVRGESNAGQVLLLEQMELETFGMNPKDMDFINSVWTSARNIANAYGVPAQMLGIPNTDTYNNMQEAKLAFWQDTMIPLMDKVSSKLTHWLVPFYVSDRRQTIFLTYDKDQITALEPRRQQKYERAQAADFLTINEKREMVGLEAIDGGDTLMVDATKIPIDMVGFELEADSKDYKPITETKENAEPSE